MPNAANQSGEVHVPHDQTRIWTAIRSLDRRSVTSSAVMTSSCHHLLNVLRVNHQPAQFSATPMFIYITCVAWSWSNTGNNAHCRLHNRDHHHQNTLSKQPSRFQLDAIQPKLLISFRDPTSFKPPTLIWQMGMYQTRCRTKHKTSHRWQTESIKPSLYKEPHYIFKQMQPPSKFHPDYTSTWSSYLAIKISPNQGTSQIPTN